MSTDLVYSNIIWLIVEVIKLVYEKVREYDTKRTIKSYLANQFDINKVLDSITSYFGATVLVMISSVEKTKVIDTKYFERVLKNLIEIYGYIHDFLTKNKDELKIVLGEKEYYNIMELLTAVYDPVNKCFKQSTYEGTLVFSSKENLDCFSNYLKCLRRKSVFKSRKAKINEKYLAEYLKKAEAVYCSSSTTS